MIGKSELRTIAWIFGHNPVCSKPRLRGDLPGGRFWKRTYSESLLWACWYALSPSSGERGMDLLKSKLSLKSAMITRWKWEKRGPKQNHSTIILKKWKRIHARSGLLHNSQSPSLIIWGVASGRQREADALFPLHF